MAMFVDTVKPTLKKGYGGKVTAGNAKEKLEAIGIHGRGKDWSAEIPGYHLAAAYNKGGEIKVQRYRNAYSRPVDKRHFFSIEYPNGKPVAVKKNAKVKRRDPIVAPIVVTIDAETNSEAVKKIIELKKDTSSTVMSLINADGGTVVPGFATHTEAIAFIHNSNSLKPDALIIPENKWKFLVRSVVRSKNIIMTGPSGTGKTLAATVVAKVLNRPFYYFNMGATQDPRATLIGNTHFNKETGTFFAESTFVKAIKTENAVILLDEFSRAHPDAWNILMTVTDPMQRYLRLDESEHGDIVKVASGVTFIATANIGSEYTSTRIIDRAAYERFLPIEMDYLTKDQKVNLLSMLFPDLNKTTIHALADISDQVLDKYRNGDGKLSTTISTRTDIELASLMYDGFTLADAFENAAYCLFSNDGGVTSERTIVKQIVQSKIDEWGNVAGSTSNTDPDTSNLPFPSQFTT